VNDLITTELREAVQTLPTYAEGLLRAYKLFQQVKSFADIERLFILGSGQSPATYRSYLQSVKDFYQFTRGMHPMNVRPADIEKWFDNMRERKLAPKTIALRIAGLRKFFSNVEAISKMPSPFDPQVMSENLIAKLRVREKGKTKQALNKTEIRKLLRWLRETQDVKDYACILFLLTSGLRASEMLGLRWENLEKQEDGGWTCIFRAKGGQYQEHEIYNKAVEVAREYFLCHFKRNPRAEDFLFYTRGEDQVDRVLSYHTLWHRVKQLGKKAKAEGIIRNSLEFTPHLMRRSYITQLYRQGMKLKALQKKSRHKNMSVLIDHYIDDSEAAAPYIAKILEGVA